MSTNKFYSTSFALTKLKHSIVTAKSGQKCLVIPLDDNYLTLKEENIYMQTDICVRTEKDGNDNWGFVKQKLPSEIYKELGAEKAKEVELPFLANLKVFEKTNNDNSGATNVELEAETDLPF
jgi:hypothetical protein